MISPSLVWIRCVPRLAIFALLGLDMFAPASRAAQTNQEPAQLSAVEDHQRVMDLLGMKTFRRRTSSNYDEAKANPYPDVPDPLVLKNGRKVTTPAMWWHQRRPEIVEDFDREIYGRTPKETPKVTWEVSSVTNRVLSNATASFPVIEKRLLGHVDNSSYTNISVTIQLTLTLPADAAGKSPVIMVLSPGAGGFDARARPPLGGGPGTNPPPAALALRGTNAPGRRGFGGFGGFGGGPFGGRGLAPWQATVLSNGWGFATLNTYSIQADGGAGLTMGIIGLCNKGQPRKLDDWGVLKAWAWGASRALDYFETDKAVDARRIGLEGHSRWGKTAAVAMAFDQRFAIAFVSSSGQGGMKLDRRDYGEVVENASWWEAYHWYAANWVKYGGLLTPGDLPVDGHELIALCAPRPVFIGSGAPEQSGDGFADPRGMFMAAVDAGPVYRLLGKKDLGTTDFPAAETSLIDGDIAFRRHRGGHTDVPNWPAFLEFASHYFKGPGLKPAPASASR